MKDVTAGMPRRCAVTIAAKGRDPKKRFKFWGSVKL